MLDHITLKVSDFAASRSFYAATLAPLGITLLYSEEENYAGFGMAPKAFFWIGASKASITGTHVAFSAPNRAIVNAFHTAAMAAGARNNGHPGLRPHYDKNYYSAFVLDSDGHNIEAVCRHPAP